MRILFSKLARQELANAANYYDIEFEGLGNNFLEEVRKAANRISEILMHGLWSEAMFGNAFYIGFLIKCFIQLRKITSLSLPLHINIENLITGFETGRPGPFTLRSP